MPNEKVIKVAKEWAEVPDDLRHVVAEELRMVMAKYTFLSLMTAAKDGDSSQDIKTISAIRTAITVLEEIGSKQ